LILFQLILGATMRHQHAGLAIHDFPLAYGKLWPATDAASIQRYNQDRVEITDINPITAYQVELQMVHRILAVLILAAVAFCTWKVWSFEFRRPPKGGTPNFLLRFSLAWLGLIFCQACLGAATVLTGKAADVATAHVLLGALSLAMGALLSIIAARNPERVRQAAVLSQAKTSPAEGGAFAARPT
jgi:cytochrome c oxidase assembly protein subunit 15